MSHGLSPQRFRGPQFAEPVAVGPGSATNLRALSPGPASPNFAAQSRNVSPRLAFVGSVCAHGHVGGPFVQLASGAPKGVTARATASVRPERSPVQIGVRQCEQVPPIRLVSLPGPALSNGKDADSSDVLLMKEVLLTRNKLAVLEARLHTGNEKTTVSASSTMFSSTPQHGPALSAIPAPMAESELPPGHWGKAVEEVLQQQHRLLELLCAEVRTLRQNLSKQQAGETFADGASGCGSGLDKCLDSLWKSFTVSRSSGPRASVTGTQESQSTPKSQTQQRQSRMHN